MDWSIGAPHLIGGLRPFPQHTELNAGFDDIQLLDVPDSFYAEAKSENPYNCTDHDRATYLINLQPGAMERMCEFDDYAFYVATDRALAEFVVPCATCTHVLVTNGDNGYAPDFFYETTRRQKDIVLVRFTHDRRLSRPTIELGGVDLGAVLLRRRVLEEGRRLFLTSLPKGARAREVHDADYWYVKHAVESGFTHVLLDDLLLMYHH